MTVLEFTIITRESARFSFDSAADTLPVIDRLLGADATRRDEQRESEGS